MDIHARTLGLIALGTVLLTVLLPWRANAGVFELSAGFNFNRRNYDDDGSYTLFRRAGGSFGYRFTERSGVEFSYQSSYDHTVVMGYQDLTTRDRVYSISWIQELLGKESAIQPYFKVGAGQLNRTTEGSYANGATPPLVVDSLTGIVGFGGRILLSRQFALRGEATSYLTGGSIATWKDDIAVTIGFSVVF